MTRQIANLIRRYPLLIRLPYLFYRRLQPRYTIGVAGVVINSSGQVLIVEHVFHPELPWGLPGGWIGRNEKPEHAIIRELGEELQLQATVQDVLFLEKNDTNHIDIAYYCEASNNVGDLSYELLNYRWIAPDELPSLKSFHQKAIEMALRNLQRS